MWDAIVAKSGTVKNKTSVCLVDKKGLNGLLDKVDSRNEGVICPQAIKCPDRHPIPRFIR